MTQSATSTDRRAQHVAALGFFLQLASFGTLLGLSLWGESHAIAAVARFMLIGLPIWFVLFLVFKQMRRVAAEQLETAELKQAREVGSSTAIFELEDEGLLIERSRLRWMVRWMLPAVTVILALVLIVGHFLWWGWALDEAFAKDILKRTTKPTLMMWFVVGIGFLCFLYARYAITLARLPNWRLLRAGATCMAGNALACLGLAVALMGATTIEWAEPLMAYLIRLALIVLGIEFALNFILDFYRPRAPDGISRPSFDSRLLGLIGEPGGLAKSIADAVNYQFGFEVSSTWFYQLLQRWLFPIIVVTLVLILALSSVVIVDAEEQVVVERFGQPLEKPNEVLNPGLHFKWPYPVDIAYRAPVRQVSELVIGEATEEDEGDPRKAIIWTEAHDYIPELLLLVASPDDEELPGEADRQVSADRPEEGEESVAVSLLLVSVPIEYRIKDIEKYLYNYVEPVKVMEGIAYQYLSDFGARVNIDQLMGPGRDAFNKELKERIQERVDRLDVGIEVVFAGIRGAHPPAKSQVAHAFQSVVAARTNMAAITNAAETLELKALTGVAGTKARADELDAVIQIRDALRADPNADPQALAETERQIEDLLMGNPGKGILPLSGEAAAEIARARAKASERISEAAAKVRAFSAELAAYEAAPALYVQRKKIEVYEELDTIRKYLIVGDSSNVIVEYETTEEGGGLDRVLRDRLEE